MPKLLKYCLFLCLLLLLNDSMGTSLPREEYFNGDIEQRNLNKEKWETTIEGFDYSPNQENEIDEDYDEDFGDASNPTSANRRSNYSHNQGNSELWASVFKFLLLLGVIVLTVVLLLNLIGSESLFAPRSKKIPTKNVSDITIENIEDNILESDMDRFIREAVSENNYALAIRLYYLAVIKELSLTKTIKWKRDKTNRDYLREMRSTSLFKPFQEATRIFESVWYGGRPLEENDYQNLKPKFQNLVNAAKRNSTSS